MMGIIEADTTVLVGMVMAMAAGALSFLSPCVLPIFPAYMSYITGISVKELQGNKDSKMVRKLLAHAFFFLLAMPFTKIALHYIVFGTNLSISKVQHSLDLAVKNCAIIQSVNSGIEVVETIEVRDPEFTSI